MVDSFAGKTSFWKRFLGGPKKQVAVNHEVEYRRNKVALMRQRTLDVLDHMMMGTEQNSCITTLIQQQFEHVQSFINQKVEDFRQQISSNRQLLKRMKKYKQNEVNEKRCNSGIQAERGKWRTLQFRSQHKKASNHHANLPLEMYSFTL